MRLSLPAPHSLSIDLGEDWLPDEQAADRIEDFGVNVRSKTYLIYLNLRRQTAGAHALDATGLLGFLREQNWASPPFNEWTVKSAGLVAVGGTFETVGMGGEVVTEIFATDGTSVANFAGVGERSVMVAVTPAAQALVRTLRFG